ncbi:MAG TPA: S-layer homology domain-containing protein [Acidimicrobiales bacterium]|nr:S-layer homology domain-containing protein [Acidimicrobiales bacterium]
MKPSRKILVITAAFAVTAMMAHPASAAGLFTDDDGSTHETNIDLIAANGITQGCGPSLYCPADPVTRGQMATFLGRTVGLPLSVNDYFQDDDGTTHEPSINALVEAGIASGFADGTFRPSVHVTRGQMATLLTNAFALPPGDATFTDSSGTHAAGIGAVAEAGITKGYPDGTFRPHAAVTRGQMATFLIRALEWMQASPPAEGAPEQPDELPSEPTTSEISTAAVSWQRTGNLYCTIGSGSATVTAPTVHASGFIAWIPVIVHYDSNGNVTGHAWGEWEWSYGAQPTGIAAAPGPWRRFRDGAIGGLQVKSSPPNTYASIGQLVYDYDDGQYTFDWSLTTRGTTFCTT